MNGDKQPVNGDKQSVNGDKQPVNGDKQSVNGIEFFYNYELESNKNLFSEHADNNSRHNLLPPFCNIDDLQLKQDNAPPSLPFEYMEGTCRGIYYAFFS